MAHEITVGLKHKRKQRIGRGEGSKGKTAGRGQKGAKSRTGSHIRVGLEGGQTEVARRFGKRGFSNKPFETKYHIVNLSSLEKKFDAGATVDVEALIAANLVANKNLGTKVLGEGTLTKALHVQAHKFSKSAADAITAAGGSVSDHKGQPFPAPEVEAPADEPAVEEPVAETADVAGTDQPEAEPAE
jgi:large subunit ribosomal protein L15